MPEGAGDTSLNVESATKLIDSLLSAPADPSKVADPLKPAAAPPEPKPAEPEQPGGDEAQPVVEEELKKEDAPQPRKFKVKADGQELEVTEDELLKGYSRHEDYTRKGQKLAEERKAFETEREAKAAEIAARRQDYEAKLTAVHDALTALTPAEPDWNLLREKIGPEQAAVEYAAFDQQQKRLAKIQGERDRVRAENDATQTEKAKQALEAEREKLRDAIPEWKDPEKFKAGVTELRTYAAEKLGFTDEELNGVTDHRLLLTLKKARAFDAAQAAKPVIENKIADALQVTAPGTTAEPKVTSELTKAKQRVAKTGRLEDATAAIAELLR